MDINSVLNMLLPIVFSLVGIALIVFVVELVKLLKSTRATLEEVRPKIDATLSNVEELTTNIQPLVSKASPMMDSLQLTVDAVNLEMMRVDELPEDVSGITGSVSSASAAVENVTNAPVKAVASVASRVRAAFNSRDASAESAKLGVQRSAVERALEDYKAAEEKDATKKTAQPSKGEDAHDGKQLSGDTEKLEPIQEQPQSYVEQPKDGSELVIDPQVIAESTFFDGDPDEQ